MRSEAPEWLFGESCKVYRFSQSSRVDLQQRRVCSGEGASWRGAQEVARFHRWSSVEELIVMIPVCSTLPLCSPTAAASDATPGDYLYWSSSAMLNQIKNQSSTLKRGLGWWLWEGGVCSGLCSSLFGCGCMCGWISPECVRPNEGLSLRAPWARARRGSPPSAA